LVPRGRALVPTRRAPRGRVSGVGWLGLRGGGGGWRSGS
jgi:hypothetical protein